MKLSELLQDISIIEIVGATDIEINNIFQDTREDFSDGTLYFAVSGTQVDGYDFIEQAIGKGVVAIVCERLPRNLHLDVIYVVLESVQQSMGYMVSAFFGKPSESLQVIAVTGTNGKTTVATLLYQSLLILGQKVAVFSTAGDFMNGREIETQKKASSSMEVIEFHRNLKRAVDVGCQYVCIEATSHGLNQYRLNGTRIMRGIFTNLTQDHLDYHLTMEHYAASKQKMFSLVSDAGQVFVNIDDSYGAMMVEKTQAIIISYGDAEYKNPITKDITFSIDGIGLWETHVFFDETLAEVKHVGQFNMYNLLAVYGVLVSYDFEISDIIQALEKTTGAKGRMEIVTGEKELVVGIVDYAHTPDALGNVLKTLQDIPHKRIITIIGAGGDRDKGKRPLMAGFAQRYSDLVIVTSDNPRTENPQDIVNDMIVGCDMEKGNVKVIIDRESAIRHACEIARAQDIILLAGKGHEDYQIIGDIKYPFSDVDILKKYL